MNGPSRREPLVIAAFVAGIVFFQALFQVIPSMCRQWAWTFLISGSLLAGILVAIIVLLVARPAQ